MVRSERRLGGLGWGFMRTEDISRGARQGPGAKTKALRSAWSMDRTGLCNQVNTKKRGRSQEGGWVLKLRRECSSGDRIWESYTWRKKSNPFMSILGRGPRTKCQGNLIILETGKKF